MSLPAEIEAESVALFHDVRLEDIDPDTHADFVIARVLDHGTLRSVRALLRFYGRDRIRDFFREGGAGRVSRRTVPLWTAFFELAPERVHPEILVPKQLAVLEGLRSIPAVRSSISPVGPRSPCATAIGAPSTSTSSARPRSTQTS